METWIARSRPFTRLPEVDLQELRKMAYSMVDVELITEGARTDRRYTLE